MAKVKQKVSGCFRSEIYAKAYCPISSYLQTMANKGINPLIAIQMALNGEIGRLGGVDTNTPNMPLLYFTPKVA